MMGKLRKMSKMYYLRQIVSCLLVYCILLAVPAQIAMATPNGGTWVEGTGTIIDGVQNSTVTVNQVQSIINWDNLNTIGTPLIDRETLTFLQNTGVTNAAVLNRVIAGDATLFNGDLNATGMDIFIINTRGVVFGPDSYIQARNFVASGIDIRNNDFINSKYQFERFTAPEGEEGHPFSNVIGDVTNEGIGTGLLHGINAENVALIGQNVTNKGIIRTTAAGGAVIMVAGESVFLSEVGSDVVVEVAMDDPANYVVDNGGSQGTGTTSTIEASTGTVGKVVLAAGDIYSTAVSGVDSLSAVANRDITLVDNIQAGEITMEAGQDVALASGKNMASSSGDLSVTAGRDIMLGDDLLSSDPTVGAAGNVTANGDMTLDAGDSIYAHGEIKTDALDDEDGDGANINLYASGSNTIHLYGNVTADVFDGGDIILHNRSEVADDVTLMAGGDVRALDLLEALGDLTIVAAGGEIEADAVNMMADGSLLSLTQNYSLNMEQALDDVFNSGETDLFAKSNAGSVTSSKADTWKSIEAEAQTFINLNDSDSGGPITTKALTATNSDVFVESNLGKVYANGVINAGRDVVITAMDEGFDGSEDAIFLSDGARNIKAGRDIWLNNNTYADGPTYLTAGQDIRLGYNENLDTYEPKTLTAEQHLEIVANRDITLGGDVTVIGGDPDTLIIRADANPDNDGDVWAKGKLTTYGFDNDIQVYGENIQTDGMVSSSASIMMTAVDDAIINGNLLAAGNIDIYSSDSTTYIGTDYVQATGDITLHNNTELNGGAAQRIDSELGLLTVKKNIDKSTAGSMTLAGDLGIELGGDVTGSGLTAADTIIFEDNVVANGIGAAEDQRFDAGLGALWAKGLTKGLITKTDGDDLTLGGDAGLDLDGTVDVKTPSGYLFIEDNFEAAGDLLSNHYVTIRKTSTPSTGTWVNGEFDGVGDQKVVALNGGLMINTGEWPDSDEPYLEKTTDGNLELRSGYDLGLHAHVTVNNGNLDIIGGSSTAIYGNLQSSGDMTLTSNNAGYPNSSLQLHGNAESTDGSVEMTANGQQLRLYREGWNNSEPWQGVKASLDIVLNDDTAVRYPDATLDAGQDVIVANNEDLRGDGKLTIKAGRDILLGVVDPANPLVGSAGDVSAGDVYPYTGTTMPDSDLILDAGEDVYAHGNLTATGDITISSSDSTTHLLGDKVEATGNVNLNNNTIAADGILIHAVQGDVIVGVETETVDPLDYPGIPDLLPGVYTDTYLSGEGDLTVQAGSDVIVGGDLDVIGNLLVTAVDNVSVGNAYSDGNMDMTADNGNITSGNLKRVYDLDAIDGDLVYNGGYIDSEDGDMTLTATNGSISFKSAYSSGTMDMEAAGDIAAGVIAPAINAWGPLDEVVTITQGGSIDAYGDITLLAGNDIKGKWINWGGDTGSVYLDAGNDILFGGVFPTLVANVHDIDGYNMGSQRFGTTAEDVLNVYKGGAIFADGDLTLLAGNDINIKHAEAWNGDILMDAGRNIEATGGDILVGGLAPHAIEIGESGYGVADFDKGGRLIAENGEITLTAIRDISLKMAQAQDDITMTAGQNLTLRTNPGDYGADDRTESYTGDIRLHALNGDISIAEGYELIGGEFVPGYQSEGWVDAQGGGVSIIADEGKIYSPGGDDDTLNVTIVGSSSQADEIGVELPLNPDKKAAIVVISKEDLKFGADSELIAEGMYYTTSEEFDITGIEDEVAFETYMASLESKFGVSAIEKIEQDFEEYLGYDTDEIDFAELKPLLEEYLDSIGGLTLIADDRPAIGLLDSDDPATATIGGIFRDEGEPIDVAIYLASTDGDVDFLGSAEIISDGYYPPANGSSTDGPSDGEPYEPEFEPQGTMVIDAYDTVTLGDFDEPEVEIWNLYGYASLDDLLDYFEYDDLDGLLDSYGIDNLEDFLLEMFGEPGPAPEGRFLDVDRLEVVSRITEWLYQAVGRLPYAGNPAAIAAFQDFIGGDYILRGAGLDNLSITDGRAWVLENPVPAAPLYQEAGQATERLTLGLDGCPVLVAAASAELGIPGDTIEVSMANSYALNTDIQPCESCAKLVNAAAILADADGSAMAAMNQVFNELAPAGAPYTPEMATSIVTAFAGRVNDGTQYATAIEYIDAFVQYIAVLSSDMGSPVGDSIAFTMQKYGSGVTGSDNANMAAFVAARLETGETFAQ